MHAIDLQPAAPMRAAPENAPAKITELEGLRGLLAWWVVVSHLLYFSGFYDGKPGGVVGLLTRGHEAVDGFVILSGFVIFLLLDKGRDRYGVFIFRRFFRLFPVFLICFAAALLLAPYAQGLLAQLPWSAQSSIQLLQRNWQNSLAHFWPHLGLHLTMLHGLVPEEVLPNSAGAFLGPAWSISLEWQFYLVAPLLFAFAKKGAKPVAAICLLVIATVAARTAFGSYSSPGTLATWTLPAFLPIKAKFFFIGAVSFFIFRFVTRSRDAQALMSSAFLGLLTALAIFGKSLPLFLWAVTLGVYLCRFSASENLFSRIISAVLNFRPVQWIGRISYSTYLCHAPLIYAGLFLLLRTNHNWTPTSFLIALTAFVVPTTLLCSYFLFTFVEQPFIDAARRWSSARPTPAA